jgi:hypothetical protein
VFSGFFMPFDFDGIQYEAQIAREQGRSRQPLASTGYNFFRTQKGYTNFESQALPKNKIRLPWEFYVSVHPDDLVRAFDLVSHHLLLSQQGDFYFTVADPRVQNEYGHIRNQIILYTFTTEEGKMLQSSTTMYNHLRRIERELCSHGIRVGASEGHRDKIPGSHYIELGYYPEDGSAPPEDIQDLVRSDSNCYRLFTTYIAPLYVDSSPDEIRAFNASQQATRGGG